MQLVAKNPLFFSIYLRKCIYFIIVIEGPVPGVQLVPSLEPILAKENTMSQQEWIDIFADNLRDKIIEYGATQAEFADDCGLAKSTVSRYLKGQTIPSIFALVNMSHVLGCSIDELADFGSRVKY